MLKSELLLVNTNLTQ